jgi:signal transduction histidine kinase
MIPAGAVLGDGALAVPQPPGPKLNGSLTITICPHKENLRVEFADIGTGIPPESLEHLFEPYFTTKEKGTGLGLALTKKFIEDHGGQILVSSEVGQGLPSR